MVEAHPIDALFLDKIKNLIHLLDIVVVDSKAQAHPLAHSHAVLNACHGLCICSRHAPEFIIHILQPVQGNAHITHAYILDAPGHFPGNQGAVGGEGGTHAGCLGVLCQLEEIRPDQWLAPGKEQHRHTEVSQVIYKPLRFLRGQLILVFPRIGLHIAVHTSEVASPGGIPDHHRPHAFSSAVAHGGGPGGIAQFISEIIPGK